MGWYQVYKLIHLSCIAELTRIKTKVRYNIEKDEDMFHFNGNLIWRMEEKGWHIRTGSRPTVLQTILRILCTYKPVYTAIS